jgi:DNA (cytosine-5)-methyltransferase 1
MSAYFNDFDKHACDWMAGLMDAGLIARGTIDNRSIKDVQADDVRGFSRVHWFAGIAGWEYALQLAGWPQDRSVWSGSCPCQSYSTAGKRKGNDDERDLWPEFFRLICECRPATIFGEQVANAIRFGWIDRLQADLEGIGYAVGFAVLGAHSAGFDHIRQRLFWVADATSGRTWQDQRRLREERGHGGIAGGLADAGLFAPRNDDAGQSLGKITVASKWRPEAVRESGRRGGHQWLGQSIGIGQERRTDGGILLPQGREAAERPIGFSGGDYDYYHCRDGKTRRVKSGLEPLVDGIPFRLADGRTREGVSRQKVLHGIGNAIVPQVAAAFIRAFLESETSTFEAP